MSKKLPRVLVLAFSDHSRDPRVQRQLEALDGYAELVTMGYAAAPEVSSSFIPIGHAPKSFWGKALSAAQLVLRAHQAYYFRHSQVRDAMTHVGKLAPDVVIANDMDTLPLALALAPKAKVLVDLHEYSPDERGDDRIWKTLFAPHYRYLSREYLPRADRVLTVSPGLARLYQEVGGVAVEVLTNASHFVDQLPSPMTAGRIRLVHHGLAAPSRRLEGLLEAMELLDDRFTLDLYLVPVEDQTAYYRFLVDKAENTPHVTLRPPVPFHAITQELNQYDVGLIPIYPSNESLHYCLPNKLFEFVQARLAIVSYPLTDVATVMKRYGLGEVSEACSPQSLAETLTRLDGETVERFKQASHQAACELSSEANTRRWRELVTC